jgi:hypothetical protein
MEVSGQLYASSAFHPGGRAPGNHGIRRLGGPQSRSGRCGEEKNHVLLGIEPSPSLFRLSYRDVPFIDIPK